MPSLFGDRALLSTTSEETKQTADEIHVTTSASLLLLLFLLLLTVLTVWVFRMRHFRFIHETGLSIIYGVIAGIIIEYSPGNRSVEKKTVFDSEIFFYVLLVPIIFNAGYALKRKHFFKNLVPILVYALAGTAITCFLFGAIMYWYVYNGNEGIEMGLVDCMLFGALISATDPVTVLAIFSEMKADVDLYAYMFGESVLNDAVAIVLFRSISAYKPGLGNTLSAGSFFRSIGVFFGIFLGSLSIGIAVGLITALITKCTTLKKHPLLETALFVLLSYSTYLAAEAVGLSGIVAVLFCGIAQAHYTYNNLSDESQVRTKQLFELLNFLAENFVFSYLGLSLFTFPNHQWKPGFIVVAIIACVVSRAANIFPMSFILNMTRKPAKRIPMKFQFMMLWAGLRGAIAFSLAMGDTETVSQQIILTTTLIIVLFTVLIFGGGTTMMLQKLKIRVGIPDDEDSEDMYASIYKSNQTENPFIKDGQEKASPHPSLIRNFLNFDVTFLKPFFDSRYVDPEETDTGFSAFIKSIRGRKDDEKPFAEQEEDEDGRPNGAGKDSHFGNTTVDQVVAAAAAADSAKHAEKKGKTKLSAQEDDDSDLDDTPTIGTRGTSKKDQRGPKLELDA